ncbi:MAG TPA: ABC transporter permease [Candidatus Lumbricidophila sp.]|nr:ABC transporter permease [Candidatus Lumbricidophila sp.]
MNFARGIQLVVGLDLRQRVKGIAWYVLLGVFVLLVAAVTVLLVFATNAFNDGGAGLFSTIIMFVLLLGTLVSPALSGNAINGERDAGTLATTQVTLLTTTQLVIGKWLAAWITALAFLATAVPFLIFAVVLGKIAWATIIVSTLVTALELGVIAALGVGLSGVLTRPLFSVAVTYLAVAALSIGTLIAFTLGGLAFSSQGKMTYISVDQSKLGSDGVKPGEEVPCLPPRVEERTVPRFDRTWWFLAANPYVVVADSVPATFDANGWPTELFSSISTGIRQAQTPPNLDEVYNECKTFQQGDPSVSYPTGKDRYDAATPSWFVGLGVHLLLAVGALGWAIARTRTPAKRLPKGSRVA